MSPHACKKAALIARTAAHTRFQQHRQVDVLDPAIRARYRANTQRVRQQPPPKQSAGDRAALEAILEM